MAEVFILLSGQPELSWEFFPGPLRFRKILFIPYVARHNSLAFFILRSGKMADSYDSQPDWIRLRQCIFDSPFSCPANGAGEG